MVGDVNIDTVHISIGNVSIAPEAAGDIPAGLDHSVPGEVAGPDDITAPEEQTDVDQARDGELTQEMINLDTRSDNLHMLVSQIDKMNSKSGFSKNDERQPHTPAKINKIRSENKRKAKNSLGRACAACVFQNDCSLAGNLDAWLDVHPYKDKSGKRRPGSLRVEPPEARTKFIERLRANPEIHCDPAKRK